MQNETKTVKPVTRLDYGYGAPEVPTGVFKISPSGMNDFFGYTHNWFRQQFLGEDKFQGNTASVRGTCLHWLAQQYATNGEVTDSDYKEMEQYLTNAETLENHEVNDNVDVSDIEYSYPEMWDLLKDWIDNADITSAEQYVSVQVTPRVILQGQYDYLRHDSMRGGKIAGDYKSTGNKSAPTSMSYQHKQQVKDYAWGLRESGENITSVEVTYIKAYVPGTPGKPNKDGISKLGKAYPAEVVSFTEPYTDEDHEIIGSQIKLVAETMEYFFDNPKLAYLLFRDKRLQEKNYEQMVKPFRNLDEESLF